MADGLDARRDPDRRLAGHEGAPRVLGVRGGQGAQQAGRIVRHAAAAGQVARVDPDDQCPARSGPSRGPSSSTPARPRVPSWAGSSAGRARSSPGCRAWIPARYEVVRPPAALVHRAGHAWEQAVLPAIAARRRAALLLSPANVAPVAFGRNVVVVHDAAALREPGWYSPLYAAWQRALLPALASAGGPSGHSLPVLPARARGAAGRRPGPDHRHPRRRRRPVRARRGTGAARAPVRAHRRQPDGAQEPRGARGARAAPGARRDRPARRGRRAAAVPRGAGGGGDLARPRARRRPPRPLRRRPGLRAAVAVRGLRPHRARGDGDAGRRSSSPTAARCPRSSATPRSSPTPPTRRPSPTRSSGPWGTSACARRGRGARRRSPGRTPAPACTRCSPISGTPNPAASLGGCSRWPPARPSRASTRTRSTSCPRSPSSAPTCSPWSGPTPPSTGRPSTR